MNDARPAFSYPWAAMSVVLVGTFMVILDTTIVNVALPQIGVALDATEGIEWVVTAYLLAVGIGLPATGWLADRHGRKQIFLVSLALFTLGSFLAALSPSLVALVAFRVLQGLGGGALIPVGMAMIYEMFPPDRRGAALGIWGVAASTGPAFGPVIGGYLVTAVSWHWLLLINVPFGLGGVLFGVRLLQDSGYRERRRFDGPGLALAATGLVLWLFAFSRASEWGWGSVSIVGLLVGGAMLLAGFVRRELRVDHPILDLRILAVPIYALSLLIDSTIVLTQYSRLVFVPLELETLRGITAFEVGLIFTPAAVAAAAMQAVGGRLTDRIGPRVPVTVGGALMAVGAWMLAHMSLEVSMARFVIAMVFFGLGTGLAMAPTAVTGINALPARFVAQASTARTLNRRVVASFGVAVLATLVVMRMGAVSAEGLTADRLGTAQAAYNMVFWIAFAIALLTIVFGFLFPNAERNRALHAERARELDQASAPASTASASRS